MAVAFDESRHHEATLQLADARFRPDVLCDVLIGADRCDLIAVDRNRLGDAEGIVDGGHGAAHQYEICRRWAVAAAARRWIVAAAGFQQDESRSD